MSITPSPAWSQKTREIQNRFFDSTVWNSFEFRDGDIVIATYAKSGTTWVQQIAAQLIFDGDDNNSVWSASPWFDSRTLAPESRESVAIQKHRRFIKSHLPADALVISPLAKYLYIARDGRDAALSYFNHHFNANDDYFARYQANANPDWPPFERCTDDPLAFFRHWLDCDGAPYWPFWGHIRSWWTIRHQQNVLLLHFADLKSDLPGSIRQIAEFLEIAIDAETLPKIVEHCGFDYMKANAARFAPRGGAGWRGGAGTFINQGTNGRWREVLTPDDIEAYERKAESELGSTCARWLAHGGNAKELAP